MFIFWNSALKHKWVCNTRILQLSEASSQFPCRVIFIITWLIYLFVCFYIGKSHRSIYLFINRTVSLVNSAITFVSHHFILRDATSQLEISPGLKCREAMASAGGTIATFLLWMYMVYASSELRSTERAKVTAEPTPHPLAVPQHLQLAFHSITILFQPNRILYRIVFL